MFGSNMRSWLRMSGPTSAVDGSLEKPKLLEAPSSTGRAFLFFNAGVSSTSAAETKVKRLRRQATAVLNSTRVLLFFLRSVSAALAFGSALDLFAAALHTTVFFVAMPQP